MDAQGPNSARLQLNPVLFLGAVIGVHPYRALRTTPLDDFGVVRACATGNGLNADEIVADEFQGLSDGWYQRFVEQKPWIRRLGERIPSHELP